jgi:hypothetical protein
VLPKPQLAVNESFGTTPQWVTRVQGWVTNCNRQGAKRMGAQDTEQTSNTDEDTEQASKSETRDSEESNSEASNSDEEKRDTPQEKPEPDEEAKEKAAEMMTAYEDRPTLVLPGTGGAVSGTAVNDWLDDDGNPSAAGDDDAPAAKAQAEWAKEDKKDKDSGEDSEDSDEESLEDKTARDKEFNAAVIKEAKERSTADS